MESNGRDLSQEIRKKMIDWYIKGKGYKKIFKQLDVAVTTVAHIIQKFIRSMGL